MKQRKQQSLLQRIRIDVSLRSKTYMKYIFILLVAMIIIRYIISIMTKIIPEIPMIYYSTCKNPLISWDGKIMKIPVYTNGYKNRPIHFNVDKNIYNIEYDMKKIINDEPIIFWGSHHKTGTYVGQKLFSSICGYMKNWCCINLVTRDSIHFVNHILSSEPINVLGHSQWIWYPEKFNITSYKFVHFYRHPFRKIISGYLYHQKGIERWTQASLHYSRVCDKKMINQKNVDRLSVVEYCSGIHLCQGCCRKEHETGDKSNPYQSRNKLEYEFICKTLGQVDTSLQKKLQQLELKEGLRLEASLDFYENLRMIRLASHTWNDPNTLNINLDDLALNFKEIVNKILHHINPNGDQNEMDKIAKELNFYDAENSYIYRAMHNLFSPEHIHTHKSEREQNVEQYLKILQEDQEIARLYEPIFELYKQLEIKKD